MVDIVKKRGRPKGIPKSPVSGRQKGSLNKITVIEKELKEIKEKEFSREEVLSDNRYIYLLHRLWELATLKSSLNAAKIWIDVYHNHLSTSLSLKLETTQDIQKASQLIMDEVCKGTLPINQGKELMHMLHYHKSFRESVLGPAVEQMIEEEIKKRK